MNYLTNTLSRTWNSLNPATLSGAIDVIVIEDEKQNLSCSPFHVRFGKFQLLRPSDKKIELRVNDILTNIPMKLGDGGEAFFVFQATGDTSIPSNMRTSPLASVASSPESSPRSYPISLEGCNEPEYLDLNQSMDSLDLNELTQLKNLNSIRSISPSRAEKISKQLTMKNIPTKIDSKGELVLDMSGYNTNEEDAKSYHQVVKDLLKDEFGEDYDLDNIMNYDEEGKLRINYGHNDESLIGNILQPAADLESINTQDGSSNSSLESDSESFITSDFSDNASSSSLFSSPRYIKTLRLTSEQLKCLNLKYGANDIEFTVHQTKASVKSRIFLWKYSTPVVISDIDGTITKSDALGHVFYMIGKDWTHVGVAKLFSDISLNGYNIMYLTARSVGLSDITKTYLEGINQDGVKLPIGPVILSPDRSMAALKREVILKRPDIFKITCLTDLKSLYHGIDPFYAGFGNRITDAISYRAVDIPSSRIFTINTDGDVHMELLELAGYKSSYIHINELVDHFFPPVNMESSDNSSGDKGFGVFPDENFTDTVFWRDPIPEFADDSSLSDADHIDKQNQMIKTENDKFANPKSDVKQERNTLISKDELRENNIDLTTIGRGRRESLRSGFLANDSEILEHGFMENNRNHDSSKNINNEKIGNNDENIVHEESESTNLPTPALQGGGFLIQDRLGEYDNASDDIEDVDFDEELDELNTYEEASDDEEEEAETEPERT